MAGEVVNPEDIPETITREIGYTPPGTPVSVQDLPPEYAHRKLMAEQQGPPSVPTIAGGPPVPPWASAAEQFLLGESPYDPVKFLKEKLVGPPTPETPSVFGKTIDTSIQGLLDLILPGSVTEGILQAGTGYGIGKVATPIASQLTKSFKALRPLAREIADEATGAALITPEALQAKAFYQAADLSGKEIPVVIKHKFGKLAKTDTQYMQFTEAQEAIANLKATARDLQVDKKYHQAKTALEQVKDIENSVEKAFPGFKAAQSGYKRISDIGRVQELIGKPDPLSKFELSLREGRAVGPQGMLLKPTSGVEARFLNKAERTEILKILEDLGPNPVEHWLSQMIAGRIVGGAIGGATGYQHGGATGAALGGVAGWMTPRTVSWMFTQALRHPATRAFFKRSMEQKGGLANPNFWRTVGALGERLGMNMFNPPPEEPIMPALPAPVQTPTEQQ